MIRKRVRCILGLPFYNAPSEIFDNIVSWDVVMQTTAIIDTEELARLDRILQSYLSSLTYVPE